MSAWAQEQPSLPHRIYPFHFRSMLYEVNIPKLHFLGNKLRFQLTNRTSIPSELLNFLISVCEDGSIRLEQFFRDYSSSWRGIWAAANFWPRQEGDVIEPKSWYWISGILAFIGTVRHSRPHRSLHHMAERDLGLNCAVTISLWPLKSS